MRTKSISASPLFALMLKTATVNVAVMVANALGMIICARVLGAESRGVLAAWMIWPPILAAILVVGMNSSFIFHAKNDASSYKKYVSALLVAAGILSIVGALIMWFATPYLYESQPEKTPGLQVWMAAFAFAMTLFTLLSGISQTTQNLTLYNATRLLPPFLYLALALAMSTVSKLNTLNFLAMYITGYLVAAFALAYSAICDIRKDFRFELPALKKLATHGSKFWCIDFMAVLSAQLDKMFLVAFLAPNVVGVYAVAYGFSRILTQIQLAIATVIFPHAAGKEISVVSLQVSLAFRISTVGSVVLAFIAIALGKFAIIILYGSQYADAYPIFAVLVVESIVSGGGWILSQAFNAIGRTEIIVLRQIVGAIITCVLMYFLTPELGAIGVAISLLIGALLRFIVTVGAFSTLLGIKTPRLLLNGQDLKYLLSRLGK
ncbi:oligosaccharide flippase family protein [Cupriavidus sp. UYPR2.512]|uniref:oligosaccharide flippase family protein n=1 Tax=Cupriavidus sp. UYPR2.512 TaxID=1080187 RepID=UPI0009DA3FF5|nr:oligosaccharide flippase family protein [Cupriavidus sp. UYPR2.512]UIF89508.1 oligosaccharide flippase family protein [Cupriavidus necator]UIF90653.1 oligosaccharide flippase family protein [Cupriavidus necator]